MKNYKNEKGNILLEVLLMLAIMFVVFPFIQKNVKERSDTLRNQLIVKDMMKLKTATENYLKLKPDITQGVHLIDFSILEENGLPKNFKTSNIIGQKYRVKVRSVEKADGNVEYDAIIIADGNSEISDMRIREIVKESKGFGGYLEDGIIYGANWSLDGHGWSENWATPPVIFKVGFAKKDYQYISRNGIGSSTMKTDIFMNLNDIEMVKDFVVSKGQENLEEGVVEVNDVFMSENGQAEVSILSLEEELHFNASMNAMNATLVFPNGLNQPTVAIDDETTTNLYLHNSLHISNDLMTNSSEENRFSFADVDTVSVYSPVDLYVGSLIKTPEQSTSYAMFGKMDLSSINIDSKLSDGSIMNYTNSDSVYNSVGFVFNNIYSKFNRNKYRINTFSNGTARVSMSDVIVKKLNKQLYGQRIGNIVITDKTPVSVILRGLAYEYADIYRIVTNTYSGMYDPLPGLKYDESDRCAKQTCSGYEANDYWDWSR